MLAALLAAVVIHTLWPLHRSHREWNDFFWVYVAGRTWWEGISPYDFPRWAAMWQSLPDSFSPGLPSQPFVYPPHFVLIAMPLALLPSPAATRIWDLINVLSFVATFWLAIDLLGRKIERPFREHGIWILVILAVVNGSLRWALWESQMSIVPTLGVVGAFWAHDRKKTRWLAVFAFLASLKPQIGALPLLFLLLNGGFQGVLLGVTAALVTSVLALVPVDIAQFPAQFADCVARHMNAGFNHKGTFSNLAALWATSAIGPRLFWIGPLLAFSWIGWLTLERRRTPIDSAWLLLLNLIAIPAFLPLHGYDLVVYGPALILAYAIRPRSLLVALVIMVQVVGRMHFIEERLDIHPLAPYFTLALVMLGAAAFLREVRAPAAVAASSTFRSRELDTASS